MIKEQIDILKLEIRKLSIKDEEYLIIKFPENFRFEDAKEFAHALGDALPKLKDRIVAIVGDVEIYVAGKE